MTIEDNKALIRKWLEAWKAEDVASLDKLFAPQYTVNGVPVGVEGVKQAVQFLHAALTDIAVELNDVVAEEDKVVVRWMVRGVHTGDFLGIAASGKQLELHGINIYQIVDDRIVSNYEETNLPEVIQRLKMDT